MKYQKQIEKIRSGNMTRSELSKLKDNAESKLAKGDSDAQDVINAIHAPSPKDGYILFMGFCPGANFDNRLDIKWKQESICRFDFDKSEHQLKRFSTICTGDLVVLKKREKFGETMKVYGHGRVKSVKYDENKSRYLEMDWSKQDEIIEVPLMGCNSTVDIKSMPTVEASMPSEFFSWLAE